MTATSPQPALVRSALDRCPITSGMTQGTAPPPLREEAGDVHVERGGAREHLRVAGPAEALVALRTVGGDVEEIAALSPDDVLLQPVDQRIGRLERPGRLEVRGHDDAGDRVERRGAGKALDQHEPAALKGEVRLVHPAAP